MISWTKFGQNSLAHVIAPSLLGLSCYFEPSVSLGKTGTPVGPTPTHPSPLGTRGAHSLKGGLSTCVYARGYLKRSKTLTSNRPASLTKTSKEGLPMPRSILLT